MKRKIVLYIAMSLDGYIADETGKVIWLDNFIHIHNSYSYSDFIKEIDTVIMGMSTYKQIVEELSPNEWPYSGMKSYVLTHQLKKSHKDITFTDMDILHLVQHLKQQQGKSIWLCGGANILSQFIKEKCIDEYHLTIMPYFLGKGIRLFTTDNPEHKLKLIMSHIENGIIDVRYKLDNNLKD